MQENSVLCFIQEIKKCGFEIPKMQLSSLGGLNFVSAYDHEPSTIMANEVSSGVDYNPDVAATKALVEYFERKAFSLGIKNNDPVCMRKHSDGVAAFPASSSQAKSQARTNAYAEALERFVWAKWWDDKKIGFSTWKLQETNFLNDKKLKTTFEKLNEIVPLESVLCIEPTFNKSSDNVMILFAEIKGHGYISGGAAGKEIENTFVRATAELIRHGIALSRFIETKQSPQTFYEERLLYFGLGTGNRLVKERLAQNSREILDVPSLYIDKEISSQEFDNIICTHRCLFENQPPFVDGALERLCL